MNGQATLRAVHDAFVKAQVTASNSHANFQKLKYTKERLLQKGREYISRGRNSKNTTLERQGKELIQKAEILTSRIKTHYENYMEAEAEMARLNRMVNES